MKPANIKELDEIALFRERLTIALKAAKICVFEVNLAQQLYTFFENSEDIFGVPGDVILRDVQPYSKLSPEDYRLAVSDYFSHPDDVEVIEAAFHDIFSGRSTTYEARMRAGGSNFIWCKIDVTPILKDNTPVKMIGVITDISDIKREKDALREKIDLDAFTGLYNKESSIDLIKKYLKRKKKEKHALVLLDMDNFKAYNDSHGHYEGDKAIRDFAALLKESFGATDVVGRFGGDEFMILIRSFPDTAWLCEKLQGVLRFWSLGRPLTASAGIALYPQDADTYEALFQKADEALYQAKEKRGSFEFFSESSETCK